MTNKYVAAFNFLKSKIGKKTNLSKTSPDITQPRQLKKTMQKIKDENKRFGFGEAKTAKDRANIVRTKESVRRYKKLEGLQKKRKEGIKASKDVKKMIDTGQADRVGDSVFHRGIPEKKAKGGRIGFSEGTPKDLGKIKRKSGPMSIETAIERNKRKELQKLQRPMGRPRPRKMGGGRIGYKGGKLVGGQKKIDVAAPFGKITGADFKKLRNKKKVI